MSPNATTGGGNGRRWVATYWVAILTLLLFSLFVLYMIRHLTATEQAWTRSTYLFASVEAIAFAAVGWLFGREVHREQAHKRSHVLSMHSARRLVLGKTLLERRLKVVR